MVVIGESRNFERIQDLPAITEITGALRRAVVDSGDRLDEAPWLGIHGLAKLLAHACQRHIADAEAEGGFLVEMERRLDQPRVLRAVRDIHRKLLADAEQLEAQLGTRPPPTFLESVVQPALRRFQEDTKRHQELEADLILEAMRDVGAGD